MGPISSFVHRKCAKIEKACQQQHNVVGRKKALDENFAKYFFKEILTQGLANFFLKSQIW